ncbi:hypothetical protein C8R44DRAFT_112368 [Mycena epipterygia]|nr:hypothetical protein C8R44DRAFT_112368 [Mycena epipterygia]
MSATAATEAENGNRLTTESAVVAQFNPNLLDITAGTVGMEQPTNVDAEENGILHSHPKDASTETGATQDKVDEIPESFAATEGLDGPGISTVQEIVSDKTKDSDTSFESTAPLEKHELLVNPSSDVEETVAVEEKVSEVESPPPEVQIPDDDASKVETEVTSTITPEAAPLLNDASAPFAGDEAGATEDGVSSTQDESSVSGAEPSVAESFATTESDATPNLAAQEDHPLMIGEDVEPVSAADAEITLVEAPIFNDGIPDLKVDDSIAGHPDGTLVVPEEPEDNSTYAAETTFTDPVPVSSDLADDSEEMIFAAPETSVPTTVVSEVPSEDVNLPVQVTERQEQLANAEESIVLSSTDVPPLIDLGVSPVIEISSTKPSVPESVSEEQIEQSVVVDGEEFAVLAKEQDDTDASRLAAHEPEMERPRSPWTPSYSVTTQGPGLSPFDEEEIAELPILPPPVNPMALSIESPSVVAQAEPTVTVTKIEDVEAEASPSSDPPRPWTPSYSVVIQGSPLSTPVDLGMPEESVKVAHAGVDQPLALSEDSEEREETSAPLAEVSDNHVMTSLIESRVIVDPATLQDPDVEDDSVDSGSEAVVAALIESGVVTDVPPHHVYQDDVAPHSVTLAQEDTIESEVPALSDNENQLSLVDSDVDVPATEEITSDQLPAIDTLLTTPSEPERPKSPWTPSYSVTTQGPTGSSPSPTPPFVQEMFSTEEGVIEPAVEVSALEAPLDPPRASSPWTSSYSVSVQGSPLPASAELMDSGLEESSIEPVVEVSTLETPLDPPRASSPWTSSYSVSVQGSPHPASAELMDSGLGESSIEPVVEVSTLETPLDPPRASSPWTASYSVSVQGSPLPVSTELAGLEAHDSMEEPESIAEEIAETQADPTPLQEISPEVVAETTSTLDALTDDVDKSTAEEDAEAEIVVETAPTLDDSANVGAPVAEEIAEDSIPELAPLEEIAVTLHDDAQVDVPVVGESGVEVAEPISELAPQEETSPAESEPLLESASTDGPDEITADVIAEAPVVEESAAEAVAEVPSPQLEPEITPDIVAEEPVPADDGLKDEASAVEESAAEAVAEVVEVPIPQLESEEINPETIAESAAPFEDNDAPVVATNFISELAPLDEINPEIAAETVEAVDEPSLDNASVEAPVAEESAILEKGNVDAPIVEEFTVEEVSDMVAADPILAPALPQESNSEIIAESTPAVDEPFMDDASVEAPVAEESVILEENGNADAPIVEESVEEADIVAADPISAPALPEESNSEIIAESTPGIEAVDEPSVDDASVEAPVAEESAILEEHVHVDVPIVEESTVEEVADIVTADPISAPAYLEQSSSEIIAESTLGVEAVDEPSVDDASVEAPVVEESAILEENVNVDAPIVEEPAVEEVADIVTADPAPALPEEISAEIIAEFTPSVEAVDESSVGGTSVETPVSEEFTPEKVVDMADVAPESGDATELGGLLAETANVESSLVEETNPESGAESIVSPAGDVETDTSETATEPILVADPDLESAAVADADPPSLDSEPLPVAEIVAEADSNATTELGDATNDAVVVPASPELIAMEPTTSVPAPEADDEVVDVKDIIDADSASAVFNDAQSEPINAVHDVSADLGFEANATVTEELDTASSPLAELSIVEDTVDDAQQAVATVDDPIVISEPPPPPVVLDAPFDDPVAEMAAEIPSAADIANMAESPESAAEAEADSDVQSAPVEAVLDAAVAEEVVADDKSLEPVTSVAAEEATDREEPSTEPQAELPQLAAVPTSLVVALQDPIVESSPPDVTEPLAQVATDVAVAVPEESFSGQAAAVEESASIPEPDSDTTAGSAPVEATDAVTVDEFLSQVVPAVDSVSEGASDGKLATLNLADPAPTVEAETSAHDGTDAESTPVFIQEETFAASESVSQPSEHQLADIIVESTSTTPGEKAPATEEEPLAAVENDTPMDLAVHDATAVLPDTVKAEVSASGEEVGDVADASLEPSATNATPDVDPVPSSEPALEVHSDSAVESNSTSDGADVINPPAELPIAEVDTSGPAEAFPLQLDVSDPVDTLDDENASYLDAPPISPRSRLESTASSLFFPGGWFSKLPQGRASLDVAQGEFTPSKTTSPTLPSPPIPGPSPGNETEQNEQSEEKKGKWCVVM